MGLTSVTSDWAPPPHAHTTRAAPPGLHARPRAAAAPPAAAAAAPSHAPVAASPGVGRASMGSDCAEWDHSLLDSMMAAAGALGPAPPVDAPVQLPVHVLGRGAGCPPEETLGWGETQVLGLSGDAADADGPTAGGTARAGSGDGEAARLAAWRIAHAGEEAEADAPSPPTER